MSVKRVTDARYNLPILDIFINSHFNEQICLLTNNNNIDLRKKALTLFNFKFEIQFHNGLEQILMTYYDLKNLSVLLMDHQHHL